MSDPAPPVVVPISTTDETARIRRNRLILAIVLASVVALTTVQVTIQQLKFPTPPIF
jgi:hypothetical protein